LALLALAYVFDAAYQGMVYYLMGCLSNDPWELARYAGVYKAVQSAGAAGSFGMDATATPYLNELLASWLLCVVSLPLIFIVLRSVKATNAEDEPKVEDVDSLDGVAIPKGHHLHAVSSADSPRDEKAQVQYVV